jgi:hypothetical protein
MSATVVYNDAFGSVIDWAADDFVEIRWYDTTKDLSAEGFNDWLAAFAGEVERAGRSGVLVDATQFRMDMSAMDFAYRDANIIPRYNAAGVKRFAFLMPAGMLTVGAPPAPEGPATFPTGYFDSRPAALAWLAGG